MILNQDTTAPYKILVRVPWGRNITNSGALGSTTWDQGRSTVSPHTGAAVAQSDAASVGAGIPVPALNQHLRLASWSPTLPKLGYHREVSCNISIAGCAQNQPRLICNTNPELSTRNS